MDPSDKQTILFVDDEIYILRALERIVSDHIQVNIVCCTNGKAAISYIEQNEVSVIVSDARMPDMDGVELLSFIYKRGPAIERLLLTGYASLESTVDAINHGHIQYYLTKPWDAQNLIDALRRCLSISLLKRENRELTLKVQKQNEKLRSYNEHLEDKVAKKSSQLRDSYEGTVRTFVSMIDTRMKHYKHNNHQVITLCNDIAKIIGLCDSTRRSLRLSASLRNIGKITFEDDLLRTPFEQLNKDQRTKFCQHPFLAQAIIATIEPLHEASEIMLCIKERLNGSGYPRGLSGDEIPIAGRILACVNEFYELTCGQIFTETMSPSEAIKHLESSNNKYFDYEIINLLKKQATLIEHNKKHCGQDISTLGLQEGDILAKDVYTSKGVFVLAKDLTLTESTINKLRMIESNNNDILTITVYK